MNEVLEKLDKLSIEIHEVESFMDDETRLIEATEEIQGCAWDMLIGLKMPLNIKNLVTDVYELAYNVWQNLTIFHQSTGIDELLEKCDYIDDYLIEKGVA